MNDPLDALAAYIRTHPSGRRECDPRVVLVAEWDAIQGAVDARWCIRCQRMFYVDDVIRDVDSYTCVACGQT